ncbi:hypothetical protein H0G86_007612 [Trichoderma simmonsii]|uniref:Uncharacterized protein n=1 Tax=Trichoderma simmonsii TaxID=1491479 RepID=A0A8G0PFB1_9HYPO|nr:hypothetical protein H0G86_007612 [Trichoderma simmonsii]
MQMFLILLPPYKLPTSASPPAVITKGLATPPPVLVSHLLYSGTRLSEPFHHFPLHVMLPTGQAIVRQTARLDIAYLSLSQVLILQFLLLNASGDHFRGIGK